jgi:hypothetical protein
MKNLKLYFVSDIRVFRDQGLGIRNILKQILKFVDLGLTRKSVMGKGKDIIIMMIRVILVIGAVICLNLEVEINHQKENKRKSSKFKIKRSFTTIIESKFKDISMPTQFKFARKKLNRDKLSPINKSRISRSKYNINTNLEHLSKSENVTRNQGINIITPKDKIDLEEVKNPKLPTKIEQK